MEKNLLRRFLIFVVIIFGANWLMYFMGALLWPFEYGLLFSILVLFVTYYLLRKYRKEAGLTSDESSIL